MKPFIKGFLLRGLIAAGGGPVILAIIYAILGESGVIVSLTPREVCLAILSITALAFIVAGMGAIYQVEELPLMGAILIHGAALYFSYILIYLINGWLQQRLLSILIFTGIFIAGYVLIWLIIFLSSRIRTRRINALLRSK